MSGYYSNDDCILYTITSFFYLKTPCESAENDIPIIQH